MNGIYKLNNSQKNVKNNQINHNKIVKLKNKTKILSKINNNLIKINNKNKVMKMKIINNKIIKTIKKKIIKIQKLVILVMKMNHLMIINSV